MKKTGLLTLLIVCFFISNAQQFPTSELIYLTSQWKGERFEDGRPKIPDAIIERAKKLVSKKHGKCFTMRAIKINLKATGKWCMTMFLL